MERNDVASGEELRFGQACDGACPPGTVLAPGSQCVLQVTYAPAVAGSAQATLQWRSDGVNPGTVTLDGRATAAAGVVPPPSPAPPPSASPGGGGCTIGPPDQLADVSHAVLLALALAVMVWRRR